MRREFFFEIEGIVQNCFEITGRCEELNSFWGEDYYIYTELKGGIFIDKIREGFGNMVSILYSLRDSWFSEENIMNGRDGSPMSLRFRYNDAEQSFGQEEEEIVRKITVKLGTFEEKLDLTITNLGSLVELVARNRKNDPVKLIPIETTMRRLLGELKTLKRKKVRDNILRILDKIVTEMKAK